MQVIQGDSTIAPPKIRRFSSTNVSWLLDTRKDTIENKVSIYFVVRKGLSIDMTSGCRGTPYLRRYDREPVLKPAILLKKSWRGYRRTTHMRLRTHNVLGYFEKKGFPANHSLRQPHTRGSVWLCILLHMCLLQVVSVNQPIHVDALDCSLK